MTAENIVIGVISYLIFLFSTVLHEAAHAFTGNYFGDRTAADEGLVTIDPTPHIMREPMGMCLVPLICILNGGGMIGWGSCPYSPFWAVNNPRQKSLVALAGPMANLLIALSAYAIICLGFYLGWFYYGEQTSIANVIVAINPSYDGLPLILFNALTMNVFLCFFNLIPLPPLDGFSVAGIFLPERIALNLEEARHNPTFQMVGLLIVFFCGARLVYPVVHWFMGFLF